MKQQMDVAYSMANVCTVMSSTVSEHQRMDADFFIAMKLVEKSYRVLCTEISEEEAIRRLWRLGFGEKQCLRVLDSGSKEHWNATRLMIAQDRHPLLALALVKSDLPRLLDEAEERVEKAKERFNELVQLGDQLNA